MFHSVYQRNLFQALLSASSEIQRIQDYLASGEGTHSERVAACIGELDQVSELRFLYGMILSNQWIMDIFGNKGETNAD